jgi:hypothetical protein
MRELDPILTRYEARILTDLLRNTLGKTAKSPLSVLRMLGIIISVNPRLMFDRDLMNLCAEYFRILKSGIRTDDKNVLRQTGDGQKDRERKA